LLGGVPLVAYIPVMAVLAALACGYAARQMGRLPPAGRRHLARMLRRRHWLATIAAIAAAIDGSAAAAVALLRLVVPGAQGSAAWPALIAIAGIGVARPLVTGIIRISRRAIR
jgi:hypothetical protein